MTTTTKRWIEIVSTIMIRPNEVDLGWEALQISTNFHGHDRNWSSWVREESFAFLIQKEGGRKWGKVVGAARVTAKRVKRA